MQKVNKAKFVDFDNAFYLLKIFYGFNNDLLAFLMDYLMNCLYITKVILEFSNSVDCIKCF